MATQQAKPSWVTAMEQQKYGRELTTPSPSTSSAGFDYGVRKGLVNRGISDSDIGYNKGTGWVTVGGQNFIKPEKNYEGTTFTSLQNFNNAWNQYQKNLNQQQANTGTSYNTTNQSQTNTYNPYNTQNPYDQQLSNLIQVLTQQAQQPMTVDLNQIYNSPQYAAYQAQAQRSAQQGVRAAQEALGAAGFGRSTALAERAQGIQNDANEYLQTQVIPQLMTQAQAEKQQQLQNLISALNPLMQQQGVYDNRFNTANQYNLQRDQLTGRLLSDAERSAIPLLNELVALGNQYGTSTPEQQAQLSSRANAVRTQLGQMGIDPALYDPNLSTEQRIAAANRLGTPTLDARQLEYNQQVDQRNFEFQKAQQEWENNFKQGQFDWQKAQQAWENAFQEKNFQQQMKEAAASRGLQWANLSQRQKEFIADQAFRDKQFQLELDKFNWSIDPNNPENMPSSSKPTTNQLEGEYVSRLNSFDPAKLGEFFKAEQGNIINDLGINGYNRLYEMYFDQFGNPKRR